MTGAAQERYDAAVIVERAVLQVISVTRHPVTCGQAALWTGFRYSSVRAALHALRTAGTIRRRPHRVAAAGGRGWEWSRTP